MKSGFAKLQSFAIAKPYRELQLQNVAKPYRELQLAATPLYIELLHNPTGGPPDSRALNRDLPVKDGHDRQKGNERERGREDALFFENDTADQNATGASDRQDPNRATLHV